jgi:hypothetical protein
MFHSSSLSLSFLVQLLGVCSRARNLISKLIIDTTHFLVQDVPYCILFPWDLNANPHFIVQDVPYCILFLNGHSLLRNITTSILFAKNWLCFSLLLRNITTIFLCSKYDCASPDCLCIENCCGQYKCSYLATNDFSLPSYHQYPFS